MFHMDLLTPYHKMPMHSANYQCPPPYLVEGEEEYKVEKVVDSQDYSRRKLLQYWSSGRATQTWTMSGSVTRTCMPWMQYGITK